MKITVNGIETNYIREGSGECIVLLHGWGANITLFDAMIRHLAAYRTVIAPDMPGFGDTPEPPAPWCVDDYADFIVAFVKAMDVKSAVFLGHSFGGRVCIKLAAAKKTPFEISRLILVDSAGILPPKTLKKKLWQSKYKLGKKLLESPLGKAVFPGKLDQLRQKNGSADYNAASPLMRQVLVRVVNEDLEPLLPLIKQDTLLIWGENDTATPLSDGQKMEKLIKSAGLVTVKNAGHYSYLEQSVLVHRVLDSYLSSN